MSFEIINPATEEVIESYEAMNGTQVDDLIEQAYDQHENWRMRDPSERVRWLAPLAQLLRREKKSLSELMSREMGKPVSEAESEIEKCAWLCEYYQEQAPFFLRDEAIESEEFEKSYVSYQPIGLVLAIMPWNFPFWQVFRCAIPAICAGNGVVLKHSANVLGCAAQIEKLFMSAGLPAGLCTALFVDHEQVSRLMGRPQVQGVALTGSVSAGASVAEMAGRELKKVVLELGGSDAYLVMADANLKLAAEKCVQSRLINTGQSCIAAKRIIVHEKIYDSFRERVVDLMKESKMGDPLSRQTRIGPLARRDLRDQLHDQVQRSLQAGAELLLGGEMPEERGWFYPATVLGDVHSATAAYSEELFGPVLSLIRVHSEEEAICTANDSEFGLGAGIFSQDVSRAEEIARNHLQAGTCAVNDFVRSVPYLPFGGIKKSGIGRELGQLGLHEFCNAKTVTVSG